MAVVGADPSMARPAPWWPVWALAGLSAAAWITATTRPALPLGALALTPGMAGALTAASGLTALAVGVAGRLRRRARGPGTLLGRRSAFPWGALRLGHGERLGHVYCIGAGSSGVTASVLGPMLIQDLRAGAGVTVVQLQGGALRTTVRTWAERLGRPLVQWEPGERDSACWNPLAEPTPLAAERVWQALAAGPPPARDHQATGAAGRRLLTRAVSVFSSAGLPTDLARVRELLRGEPTTAPVLAAARSEDRVAFERALDHPEEREELIAALDGLLGSPFVLRALCPPAGAVCLQPSAQLRQGGVLLASLPLGRELRTAQSLGRMFLSALQAAVYRRAQGEPTHYVYIDDFEQFAGGGFGEFLAQSPGYGVAAVLANRGITALRARRPDLEEGVLANARTAVILRCDVADAAQFAPWLPPVRGRGWLPDDLSELPFGFAVARRTLGGRARAERIRLRTLVRG